MIFLKTVEADRLNKVCVSKLCLEFKVPDVPGAGFQVMQKYSHLALTFVKIVSLMEDI